MRGRRRPERVALISTPFIPVPPPAYGGTELVVAELARALTAAGVEVVVYSTGDSHLPGIEVRAIFPAAVWPPAPEPERRHARWALDDIAKDPRGFDVVHSHSSLAVELSRGCPAPVVHTLHHLQDAALSRLYQAAPHARLVAISARQAQLETARVSDVVLHGLSPERFRPGRDLGYLLFLGRYSRVKAPHLAVRAAIRAGMPIVLAGLPHEQDYYEEELRPLLTHPLVHEVGAVGGLRKTGLLSCARALLFPIEWDEPFGLVMIESLLSGVPVLAFPRGSVEEVLDDGLTGALCTDWEDLARAAKRAALFQRDRIRAIAVERFSAARMAREYLAVYQACAVPTLERAAVPPREVPAPGEPLAEGTGA